jgi:hypothetical protein
MKQLTFEINNKTYDLPNKITIENYIKFFKIKNLLVDAYFDAKLVNIFTGCPVEDLLESDWDSVKFLSGHIQSMMPTDKTPFVETFELNGVEYGFVTHWREMSFAQYADIETLISKEPEDMVNYLHVIAAIFYRPIIKKKTNGKYEIEKYNTESMDERSYLFNKELDVSIVIGAQFFFTLFAETLQSRTQQSLTWKEETMMMWMILKMIIKNPSLVKRSNGIQSLIDLQMMTLQNTIQSLRKPLQKSSISSPSLLERIKRSLKRKKTH